MSHEIHEADANLHALHAERAALRLRDDGTPEMLIPGTLADGPRYEASAEAARAWQNKGERR